MNRILILTATLVVIGLAPLQAKKGEAPAEKRHLAVAPFKQVGVAPADADVIADALRSELSDTRTFKVVDRQQMDAILGEQRFQLLGVTSESEAVKLGRILNVQEMVFGSMSKLGKTYYLTLTAISIETAEVRASESLEGRSIKVLRKRVKKAAEEMAMAYRGKGK